LAGIAAAYGQNSGVLHSSFVERIQTGAFTKSLKSNPDVVATFNHDQNHVLGRTKSGTLTLSESSVGLAFYCQLDRNNSEHANIYASVKRGDITQCSFMGYFQYAARDSSVVVAGKSYPLKTVVEVALLDIAVVTYPAYPEGTSVDARKNLAVSPELRGKFDTLIQDAVLRARLRAAELVMKRG
jgi:HK97 family phage prohead protease